MIKKFKNRTEAKKWLKQNTSTRTLHRFIARMGDGRILGILIEERKK